MWRRYKYKLRQVHFRGDPRCRGQSHSSRRGLFRLEINELGKFVDLLKMNWGQFGGRLEQIGSAPLLKLDPDVFPKLRSDGVIHKPGLFEATSLRAGTF